MENLTVAGLALTVLAIAVPMFTETRWIRLVRWPLLIIGLGLLVCALPEPFLSWAQPGCWIGVVAVGIFALGYKVCGVGDRQSVAKSFMPYYDLSSTIFQMDFSGLWERIDPYIELISNAASLSEDHQVTLTGVDGRLHIGDKECSLRPRLVKGPCELKERHKQYSCRIRQPLTSAMAQELTMGLSDMNLSTEDGRVRISCLHISWVGTVQTTSGKIAPLPKRIVSEESVLVRGPIRESDTEKVLWRVEPQFVSQVHYYLHDSSLR